MLFEFFATLHGWPVSQLSCLRILGLATIRVLRRFALCLLALLYSYPDLPANIFLQPLESVSEDFAPATCLHHSNLCPNLCPNLSSESIAMPAACLPAESGATAFPNLTRAPVPWLPSTICRCKQGCQREISERRAMEWHGQGAMVNA